MPWREAAGTVRCDPEAVFTRQYHGRTRFAELIQEAG